MESQSRGGFVLAFTAYCFIHHFQSSTLVQKLSHMPRFASAFAHLPYFHRCSKIVFPLISPSPRSTVVPSHLLSCGGSPLPSSHQCQSGEDPHPGDAGRWPGDRLTHLPLLSSNNWDGRGSGVTKLEGKAAANALEGWPLPARRV